MAMNARRLCELSMVPPLAKELVTQVEDSVIPIGTTAGTAMAGNRTPTQTIRGGVTLMPAQADSVASDVAGLVTDFNALLAKLRTAGALAP